MSTRFVDDQGHDGLFRVRTDVFRDQDIFDIERKAIFDKSWLYVGHASEIPDAGSFVTRSVGGHPVIMVRQRDGDIKVLFNTCAHQSSMVCRVPCGTSEAFQCFFHGWTYDLDGSLLRLPGEASYCGQFTKEQHGLAAPRVDSYRGFVFMCSDSSTPSLDEYLGQARTYLDLVADQDDEMVVLPGSHKYAIHGNWKMATMNANDGYHVGTTHATYLRYLRNEGIDVGARRLGRRPILGNGHTASEFFGGWGRPIARWAAYWPESLKKPLERIADGLRDRHGEERAHLMTDVDRNLVIFPNLVINDHSSIIIRTWDPVSPGKVVVTGWCLVPKEEDKMLRALRLKNYLTFFGPGGFATPDDIEALNGVQVAFRNPAMEWLDASKGATFENKPNVSDNAEEDQTRAFWRRWQADIDNALEGVAADA